MFNDGYMVYAINTLTPTTNLAEFIAYAKKQPGKLNVGTPGSCGNIHVSIEMFKLRTGLNIVPVHYKSMGNVYADLPANEIQLAVGTFATLEAHRKAGKMRLIFVARLACSVSSCARSSGAMPSADPRRPAWRDRRWNRSRRPPPGSAR